MAPRRQTSRVRLDLTGCLRETIGRAGLTARELAQGTRAAVAGGKRLRRALDASRYGFDAILDDRGALEAARAEGRRLSRLVDTLVVDGIGGSALGALALEAAL
ncbi:MAG TPA: hypothetical protein VFQ51_08415, partial [Vicinamibacteria bacterium]|nr:hypothetical protein [Vicinamibacteria bacterium]